MYAICLICEVSRSRKIRHTHLVGLLSDELILEAATYTTHNKHKKWTPLPSTGFKPTIQHYSSFRHMLYTAWPLSLLF